MNSSLIKRISVQELKTKMDETPDLFLIDVREINEWQEQRIPGAIHIPKDSITDHIASVTTDKEQPIFLHCRSGMRSLYAAECLISLGYNHVYSVDGGIMDWANSRYPIE